MQSELLAARERAAGLEAQVFAHTAAEYAGKGDTVLITEDGFEFLTHSKRDEIIIKG